MTTRNLFSFFTLLFSLFFFNAFSQNGGNNVGQIHGNFETINQYYNPDTAIGAPPVPEKLLSSSFANIIFNKGNFTAGARFESYLNVLQGIDSKYNGTGIPYKYASYQIDNIGVTVGNFYEQFGSGMIFRSYEARSLGIDNAMEGVRVTLTPIKGIYLKGIVGKQRLFFSQGPGIVRGIDGEININELHPRLDSLKTRLTIGGSFVSKYQKDDDPTYNLPENVGAYAGRFNLYHGRFTMAGEYAYKINDPNSSNNFIYKPGQGAILALGYSKKGLGISLSGKMIDNMDYRSDRTASLNNLTMSYLPALSKQHTYNLAATLYPYGTQPNGEMGIQADIIYKIKKKSRLGGKYGTLFNFNYSRIHSLNKEAYPSINDPDSTRMGYKTNYLSVGDEVYFEDINLEITKKINKKWKAKAAGFLFIYNMEVIQGLGGKGTVYANVVVLDVSYKIKPKHAVRVEAQHLSTDQDQGSWATLLAEYTFSPNWFVAVMDQYNYGNKYEEKQLHYPIGTFGYTKGGNRIMLSYGRQRAGIFCVGGVCRNVPASNGVTLSITSSF